MLDGAADAARDVKGGVDRLTCLPDLHAVGAVTRINRSPRRTHGRSEEIADLIKDAEVLSRLERPTTGDDLVRLGEVRLVTARLRDVHNFVAIVVVEVRVELLFVAVPRLDLGDREGVGAHREELRLARDVHHREALARVQRPHALDAVVAFPKVNHVGTNTRLKQGCGAGQQILPEGRRGPEHDVGTRVLNDLRKGRGVGTGHVVLEGVVADRDDLVGPPVTKPDAGDARTEQHGGDVATVRQLLGLPQQFAGGALRLPTRSLAKHQNVAH